ncbi:hypothetical protein DPMN_039206 [Dreissena polymorpha]|uniref:Uncharacterized protein n=1 Tax=Dreissena polymorpha TaxID=45954 RepID=A0A9D4RRH0_DREPO|nr:hypothetical protein DPMN_039206 [Dreissena polymorpha]
MRAGWLAGWLAGGLAGWLAGWRAGGTSLSRHCCAQADLKQDSAEARVTLTSSHEFSHKERELSTG